MALKQVKYIKIDDKKGTLYSAGKQSLLLPITFIKVLSSTFIQLVGKEGAEILISKIGEAIGKGYAESLEAILEEEGTKLNKDIKIRETCNAIFMEAGWGRIEIRDLDLKKKKLTVEISNSPSMEVLSDKHFSLEKGIITGIYKHITGEEIYCYFAKEVKKGEKITLCTLKEVPQKVKEKEKIVLVTRKELHNMIEKRTEQLEEERNKVDSIIASFTGPVIFLNKDNKVDLFNEAASRILNMSEEDYGKKVEGEDNFSIRNFRRVIHRQYSVQQLKQVSGEEEEGEEVALKYKGEEKTYKVKSAFVYDENEEYLGMLKVFYDLTREKTLDELKTRFVSLAAHQLRTPLTAIKWVIAILRREKSGKINKKQEELLDKAHKRSEDVIDLVDNLLNVSRLEEGKFDYNFQKCDLKEIVDEILEETTRKAYDKKQEVNIHTPDEELPVKADREKLRMVFQNIIENAIQYTAECGTINIMVKREGKNIVFIVEDNGVGIPADEQNKIFSKFFRASNAMKIKTEGNGLGLYICKNIVNKHHGDIEINSTEGEGTKVTIKIPKNR